MARGKGPGRGRCETCGVPTALPVHACGRCARDSGSGASGMRRINGRRAIYGMPALRTVRAAKK